MARTEQRRVFICRYGRSPRPSPYFSGYRSSPATSRERLANACVVESGTRPDCCPARPLRSLRTSLYHRYPLRSAGHTITSRPSDVARIALPLLCYFAIMWFGSFALGRSLGLPYDRTATLAFNRRWQQLRTGDRRVHRRLWRERVARHWPASSAPSSRYRYSLPWSTCRCGRNVVSTHSPPLKEPHDRPSRSPFPVRAQRR